MQWIRRKNVFIFILTPLPKVFQTKYLKLSDWRFIPFATSSCENLREFSKKFQMVLMGYSIKGLGKLTCQKTWSRKSRGSSRLNLFSKDIGSLEIDISINLKFDFLCALMVWKCLPPCCFKIKAKIVKILFKFSV
jgi:hypothetical protein